MLKGSAEIINQLINYLIEIMILKKAQRWKRNLFLFEYTSEENQP